MSGFTNPVHVIREKLLNAIAIPRNLRRNHIWAFMAIEITVIIIMFAIQADRFRYFCAVLTCTPLGGLAGTAEGMGESIGKGENLAVIMKTWIYDYGHWSICSIQYFAALSYIKLLEKMDFHRIWQFIQSMIFTLFSSIILYAFSSTFINGRSGLIVHIWNAYMGEEKRGTENPYFPVFVIMIILILIVTALGVCCILDHLNTFFRYALIMGVIWLILFGLVMIMGYRVLRGIGTSVEISIIKLVWPAFGNPVPLYWLTFIMFLMLISLTMLRALDDTGDEILDDDADEDDLIEE